MGGAGGYVIPLSQAVYCSNPDAVESCLKLCPAADVVSIGVRLGSYLQALAYFALVLFAPDEGGAESMWLGLSVSFSFLMACYVQLFLGTITLHHTVVVILLSHLPYIATLAGMNSLTTYEVLGPTGVRFLQGGMILKGLLTVILWALCLFAYYVGQLPSWTFLRFRQANCFTSTAIVVWFYPVRPNDGHNAEEIILLTSYSLFWFLVVCIGSYWTLIAPGVLVKRGGHLRDPHMKKIKGFPMKPHKQATLEDGGSDDDASDEANHRRRQHMRDDPDDYKRDEYDDGMNLLTMRSISKSATSYLPASADPSSSLARTTSTTSSLPSYRSRRDPPSSSSSPSASGTEPGSPSFFKQAPPPRPYSPPPATEGMTALSPWSKGLRGTAKDAAKRLEKRQEASKHHLIIWPFVAVLLVFTIATTEIQMVANDVFPGEMHLDFPGALTFFLALPTLWAVAKALKRIQEGRRPTPQEREDKTFYELAAARWRRREQKAWRKREARRRREESEGNGYGYQQVERGRRR
ncbi:hypothetical protein Rt10032_c07g3248 [Rhodotorula toruloides]|uniref:Uncharacterized protein n=1 Tax=Rhodotorula toruloides TaxID=5286 RepID=A0A511KFR6_RHOTO|nr:hypothetical protein Rt10032_c07g3248 [Rhodotorula toruloides]